MERGRKNEKIQLETVIERENMRADRAEATCRTPDCNDALSGLLVVSFYSN